MSEKAHERADSTESSGRAKDIAAKTGWRALARLSGRGRGSSLIIL